ncbi:MAG: hypothetical protein ABIY46_06350 [Gemmatimonadales bacterium]
MVGSSAGGIPFGMFALPPSNFGDLYNGGKLTVSPNTIARRLSAFGPGVAGWP